MGIATMGLGLLRTFFLDYILVMLHEQCNYGQLPAAQLFSNVMRGNNTAANNMCCMRRSSQSLAKRNRAERIIDVLWTILRSGVLMSDQGRMSVTSQGSPFPVSLPPFKPWGNFLQHNCLAMWCVAITQQQTTCAACEDRVKAWPKGIGLSGS